MKTRLADLAWAAGFMDGEGYFHLQPVSKRRSDGYRNRKPRVEVAQTSRLPLLKLKEMFGGSIVALKRYGESAKSRKPAWRWDLVGVHVKPMLMAIRPFLVVKAKQADLLLEFSARMKPKNALGCRPLSPIEMRARNAIQRRLCAARKRG